MNNILSKLNIKKNGSGRLPSKRSMNLYVKVKDGNSWQVILPLAIFLALVVFGIYKLGVVNRLNKLNSLRQENSQLELRLNTLNAKLDEYPQLEESYRRYTASYLQPDEIGLVRRTRIFDMCHESSEGVGTIKNISIEGNQVGMIVDIASLEDIEIIQDRLNDMDNIDEISVSTAKGTNNVDVEGYIIFKVKEDGSSDIQTDNISAEERAPRIDDYSQAAIDARNAKADSYAGTAAQPAQTGAASGSSGSSASAAQQHTGSSSGSGQAAASGSTAAGSPAAAGTEQNIGGDSVVVLPEGVSPFGFDSLEDGQKQLQEAGQ